MRSTAAAGDRRVASATARCISGSSQRWRHRIRQTPATETTGARGCSGGRILHIIGIDDDRVCTELRRCLAWRRCAGLFPFVSHCVASHRCGCCGGRNELRGASYGFPTDFWPRACARTGCRRSSERLDRRPRSRYGFISKFGDLLRGGAPSWRRDLAWPRRYRSTSAKAVRPVGRLIVILLPATRSVSIPNKSLGFSRKRHSHAAAPPIGQQVRPATAYECRDSCRRHEVHRIGTVI